MHGRALRQKLRQGERVYGIALEGYGQPRWPRYFAQLGVIDFVFMDSEHTPQNRETIAWAAQCYAAYGIAPLLRIPHISPSEAAMALDAGAHGVIVPYVESLAQAKSMVGTVKYRPLKGQALQQILDHGTFPAPGVEQYLADFNPDAVLVLMIESPTGIQNLPDMLAFGGVDAILVGPHDLSISLGIPEQYDHPDFLAAIQHIVDLCQAHHVGVGMHIVSGTTEEAQQWVRRGFTFVSLRSDTLYVARGAAAELKRLRGPDDDETQVGISPDEIGGSGHST